MSIFLRAIRAIEDFKAAGQTAQRVYLHPTDAADVRVRVSAFVSPVDAVAHEQAVAKTACVEWYESDEVPVGTVRVE